MNMQKLLSSVAIPGLVLMMTLVVGCVKKPQTEPKVAMDQLLPNQEPTITRLQDQRTGFVIMEPCDLTAAWRDDFDDAVDMLRKKNNAEAISLLEQVIQQSPGVTAPHINLAIAYRQNEKIELAEEQLQAALDLIPNHPVASQEYGLLLRQTGRFNEAREVYEASLQSFPEYLPNHLNLGILCELYLNDLTCAADHYAVYSEANPDIEDVQLWIADLNMRLGRN